MDKISRNVHVERYYPDVLLPAKEFKALSAAENEEFNALYVEAWKWFANTFVYDTDADGVGRWEKMLGITPLQGESLSDRRKEILFKINNRVPYTERTLKQMYDIMYGENTVVPEVRENLYELVLNLTGDAIWKSKKVKIYARSIVPANLVILTSRFLGEYPLYFHAAGIVQNYKKITVDMDSSVHLTAADTTINYAGQVVHNYRKLSISGGVLSRG